MILSRLKKLKNLKNIVKNIFTAIPSLIQKLSHSSVSKKTKDYFVKFITRYSKWFIIFITAIVLADLSLLFLWPLFLPESDISIKPSVSTQATSSGSTTAGYYVHSANIFHRGEIPDSLQSEDDIDIATSPDTSTPSTLPLTLLGTVESSDPKLSMASIFHNLNKVSQSYFVGETIRGIARITAIERKKVTFINLTKNRLEHIEIPLEEQILFTESSIPAPQETRFPKEMESPSDKADTPPDYEGISQTGENAYAVDRSTINSHLQKLPDILQQARVVPKYSTDGRVLGHTFKWIKEGSIFEGLGLKEGDTIISVNGEKVSNPTEASELFQRLRTSSQIQAVVENQDGNVKRLTYEVTEDASVQ